MKETGKTISLKPLSTIIALLCMAVMFSVGSFNTKASAASPSVLTELQRFGIMGTVSGSTYGHTFLRLLKNIGRNIKATGPMFLLGILLSALFQRYIPQDWMVTVFGGNEAWGVLMAATIGVPLYACGGGTIPLIRQWLQEGMSLGSAAAFMLTGPSTKITNLGALKIVLGIKRFMLYFIFVMLFSFLTGIAVNLVL